MDSNTNANGSASSPIDPLMQDRLARLQQRRVAGDRSAAASSPSTAGRPSVPPTSRTTPSGTAPKGGRTRKRHAAKGSRVAAVLMSIGTTAGLSAYFQHADAADAAGSTVTGVATANVATANVATAVTTATTATMAATATEATTAASTAPTADTTATAVTLATTATTATSATTVTAQQTAAVTTTSGLADGTYTGVTDTNKWGPVQVQITIVAGQITDVVALQTPFEDGKSVSINNRATPILASEVLTAQSAQIDTVSGATYTTNSYKVSLQSAIDLAQTTALQAASA